MRKKKITRIEATAPVVSSKLNVAVYCRVSTARDQQLTSLENQKKHYEGVVKKHSDWNLVDFYYEEGVSGTKKEIRPELQRMLSDCGAGKIDLILTKSISRFARNTTDCLEMVRVLTDLGVNVFFEKENLNTGSMDGEFLLTILASIAEEESKSISGNEFWAVQKRFQAGTFKYSKAPYGYDLENGNFVINEEEAKTVRWIFQELLAGKGTFTIAKELNEKGIPPKEGDRWFSKSVHSLVTNVVYIGDVLMQKTYSEHFKTVPNRGEKPQYYMDDHHPAIIDRETFEKAQSLLSQRCKENGHEGRTSQPTYCFSGKLICGYCGHTLRRITQYTNSGKRYHWSCGQHLRNKEKCSQTRVLEEDIKNAFITLLHKLNYSMTLILDEYVIEVGWEEAAEHRDRLTKIHDLLKQNNEKRQRFASLLSKGCVEPFVFKQEMVTLEEEASRLKEERNLLVGNRRTAEEARAFRSFVGNFSTGSGDFPEEEFTEFVEKVIIHSAHRFTFCFKCGLCFTEDSTFEAGENDPEEGMKSDTEGREI